MNKKNPHSPPGPYVLFDNLDDENRIVMNVWTVYDPNSPADGLYMKYIYIFCKGHEFILNLWTLDILKPSSDLSLKIEWDKADVLYHFEEALRNRKVKLNNKSSSYLELIPKLNNSQFLRNLIFSSGDVKILSSFEEKHNPFSYEHQLVYDSNRPVEDDVWDISENVTLRFRIKFTIELEQGKYFDLLFDRGARGLPTIKPRGWYPTRKMDGILIARKKAYPLSKFTYIKHIK